MNKSYLVIFFILITLSTNPSEQLPLSQEKTLQYKRGRNHIRRCSKIVAPAKEEIVSEPNKKKNPSGPMVATRTPENKLQ